MTGNVTAALDLHFICKVTITGQKFCNMKGIFWLFYLEICWRTEENHDNLLGIGIP